WEGVSAHNSLHLFAPYGSPATYEIMGANVPRVSVVATKPSDEWNELNLLDSWFPVVVGRQGPNGQLVGESLRVNNKVEALVLLQQYGGAQDALRAELLTFVLNEIQARQRGEDLLAAT